MKQSNDRAQATPTKQFFVSMLTRDISLDDAILDLLDNCLDGAMRVARRRQGRLRPALRSDQAGKGLVLHRGQLRRYPA